MDQQVIDNFYEKQAGDGLVAYSGPKYQQGYGLNFGRILRVLKPAFRYIGRHGLRTLTNIGRDLLEGENFAETTKSHLKNTGKRIAGEMLDKTESYLDQSGGRIILKRRKKYKSRKIAVKKRHSKPVKKKKLVKRAKIVRKRKKIVKKKIVRKKRTKINFL